MHVAARDMGSSHVSYLFSVGKRTMMRPPGPEPWLVRSTFPSISLRPSSSPFTVPQHGPGRCTAGSFPSTLVPPLPRREPMAETDDVLIVVCDNWMTAASKLRLTIRVAVLSSYAPRCARRRRGHQTTSISPSRTSALMDLDKPD